MALARGGRCRWSSPHRRATPRKLRTANNPTDICVDAHQGICLRDVDNPCVMSAAIGLPLIGILLIVLVLVHDAARQARLRRKQRERRTVRYYWERTESSSMRHSSDRNGYIDTLIRSGIQPPSTLNRQSH